MATKGKSKLVILASQQFFANLMLLAVLVSRCYNCIKIFGGGKLFFQKELFSFTCSIYKCLSALYDAICKVYLLQLRTWVLIFFSSFLISIQAHLSSWLQKCMKRITMNWLIYTLLECASWRWLHLNILIVNATILLKFTRKLFL